jgi:hypothetical protein
MDDELKDKLNRLADVFYASHGYISRPYFDYSASTHPQERLMFILAQEAYEFHCNEGFE